MSQPEPASTQPPAEPPIESSTGSATGSPSGTPIGTPAAAPGAGKPPLDVRPLEIDLARIVAYGTVLFALAFVGMLVFHADLTRAGHRNWPWIALAGTVFGLLGWAFTRRRGGAAER